MSAPGFTAEASVYKVTGHYYAMSIRDRARSREGVVATFPMADTGLGGGVAVGTRVTEGPLHSWTLNPIPQINVTYQRPQPPFGQGFPGTLTITGQNFARNVEVTLTIDNCESSRLRTTAYTSPDRFACLAVPPYTCFTIPGGSFTTTVACYCGGPGTALCPVAVACVEARDTSGNIANGTTAIPC